MADKGLYLEVAGGVEKKLLTDLENLENRLKSLLEGMKTKPQTKQFKRVQEQIKALSNLFGALKEHFQESTGAIEKSAEGITKSLKNILNSSNPALQEFGAKLESIQGDFEGAHGSVKNIIPDLERFLSLIENFEGGNTRPITSKYNNLEKSVKDVKDQFIDLEEAAKGVYELKPKNLEIDKPDTDIAKGLAAKFGKESQAIIDDLLKINETLSSVGSKASDQFSIAEKEAEKFKEKLAEAARESVSLLRSYGRIDGKPVEEVRDQFKFLISLVRDSTKAIKNLNEEISSVDKEKVSVGTESGSVFDEKMRLQDMSDVESAEAIIEYLEEAHRQINKTNKALEGQGDFWKELENANEEVTESIKRAYAEQKHGAEQAAEVLIRWKEELNSVQEALNKQTGLKDTIDAYREAAAQSKKSADVEKRSFEEKQKVIKDAEEQLRGEREKRKQASKEAQSQAKEEADTVQKSVSDQIKVRKRKRKVLEEEADIAEKVSEQTVESARKAAKETEKISKEQREKISESTAAGIDFSQAEKQFKNFTDKVEKGVSDLSNSIKGIFSSLEGLIKEGVRTVEVTVKPKGFDETVEKQRELDTALHGSARTAEEVSQREQQAFLESAAAFVSASDTITEHQKEVDDALEHSGDVAEKVSDKEKKAFSEAGEGPDKIKVPEAESDTLDLMAQLLIQVTRNLDLMSQKLDAAKSDVRDFNDNVGKTADTVKDFADEAEEAASKQQVEHLKAYNEVYSRMREYLGDTSEAMSGAKSRAKELADQTVKLGISMREIGAFESKEEFKEWVNEIDVASVSLKEHENQIKKTAKGYRPLTEEGQAALNITDEMRESLEKNVETASLYEKRMYELAKASAGGNEEAKELGDVLRTLGSSIGESDEAFKRFNKQTVQLQQHFKDLARRSDEATEQIVKDVDLARVAFQAYEGNIKVTKDSFEILNEEGYKPFNELNEEAAKGLGLIGKKFDSAKQKSTKYKESLKSVSNKTEAYEEALKGLKDKYGDNEYQMRAYNKAIRDTQRYVSELSTVLSYEINQIEREIQKRRESGQSVEDLNQKLERKKHQLKEVASSATTAEVAMDRFEDEIQGTSKAFKRFDRYVGLSRRELGMFGKSLHMVGKRMKQFAAFAMAALVIRELTQAVRVFIETLSDYDQALYNLMAILEVTTSRVAVLGDQIQKVAQYTKFSATEVAQAVQTLGQAGLTIEEVGIALVGVTRLATGTLSEIGDVADLTTTALNSFRLEAVETTRTSDIFANAINNSKLNVDKLRTAFNYVGAAGKQVGLDLNELTGTLMVLADNGIRASTMGTGLRRMMLKMLSPTTELKAEIDALGMDVGDLNPKIVGWEKAIENLIPILWDAQSQSLDMAETVDYFGTRAAQVAAIVVRSAADGSEAISKATEKTYEYGAAQEMSEKQQRGLALSIKNLQDRFKNLGIAIGEAGFTGVVKDAVDALRELTGATYEWVKAHPRATQIIGWAGAVVVATLALSGMNKIIWKLRRRWSRLNTFVNKKFLVTMSLSAAAVAAVVIAFDQLVSWHYEAAKAASKHAQELNTASDAMKSWGETLNNAFATREWENTVVRFREETKEAGGEVENLAGKLEDKLGHSLDAISGPSGLGRFNEAWKELRREMLAESIDKTVESINNLRTSMRVLFRFGININDYFDEASSSMDKFANKAADVYFKTMMFNVPGLDKFREIIVDVFGPDKQELLQRYGEEISNLTLQLSKMFEAKGWDVDRIIQYMDDLGEKVGKTSVKWEDLTNKMSRTTFAPIISGLRDISYESRKQMSDLSSLIEEREREGKSIDEQKSKLKSLEVSYATQREAFEKAEEGLAKVIRGEQTLTGVLEGLREAGHLTANQMDDLRFAMERKLMGATGKALSNFEALRTQLKNVGDFAVNMYRSLDPTDKMDFDKAFNGIIEESEKLKAHLESTPIAFRDGWEDVDEVVSEFMRKRVREELEALLKIEDRLDRFKDTYEETYEEINDHIEDIFSARRDIINRHYEWEKREVQNSALSQEEILAQTVEAERRKRDEIKNLIKKEYETRKRVIEEETRGLLDLHWDNAEEREKIEEENADKIKDLEEKTTRERKSNLENWLTALNSAYDEAIGLSEEYADEVISLQKEIEEERKKSANRIKDLEKSLENDLYDIRKSGLDDAASAMLDFRRANELITEGKSLVEAGEYDRANDLLKEAAGLYKQTASAAASAKKEGEDYAISQSSAIAGLKNAYKLLRKSEEEEKEESIEGIQDQINSFKELKGQVDEYSQKYKGMISEVMGQLNKIDEKTISNKEFEIKSNTNEQISKVDNLIDYLNRLDGKTVTYRVNEILNKAAGGLVRGFDGGGSVPGSGDKDTVPAMLTPGEYVVPKDTVSEIGVRFFETLRNKGMKALSDLSEMRVYQGGGLVQKAQNLISSAPQTVNSYSGSSSPEKEVTLNLQIGDRKYPTQTTNKILKDITKELRKKGLAV